MKSKKKNSNRSHHNSVPFEMFNARARYKKYQKSMKKAREKDE